MTRGGANSLYIGLPDCDIKKLQRVQNIAAKTVLNNEEKSMFCLKKLHWLPVSLRIKFKVLTIKVFVDNLKST